MTHRLLSFVLVLSLTPSLAFAQAAAPAATPAPAPTETPAPAPAPAAPMTPAPADTTTTTPADRPTEYTIQQGDSLWTVAHKYGTTVVKLRKLNNLKKGALLHPGQVLKLPPATAEK